LLFNISFNLIVDLGVSGYLLLIFIESILEREFLFLYFLVSILIFFFLTILISDVVFILCKILLFGFNSSIIILFLFSGNIFEFKLLLELLIISVDSGIDSFLIIPKGLTLDGLLLKVIFISFMDTGNIPLDFNLYM